jgi:hypothetical protein
MDSQGLLWALLRRPGCMVGHEGSGRRATCRGADGELVVLRSPGGFLEEAGSGVEGRRLVGHCDGLAIYLVLDLIAGSQWRSGDGIADVQQGPWRARNGPRGRGETPCRLVRLAL